MLCRIATSIAAGVAASVAASVCALSLVSTVLSAQTRFEWGARSLDLNNYRWPEMCRSRVNYERNGSSPLKDGILEDTLQWENSPPEERPPVVASARACIAKFRMDTVSLDEIWPLMALYLVAGQDADAQTLLQRKIASVENDSVGERRTVYDNAFTIFSGARPARLDAIEQWMAERERAIGDSLTWWDRLGWWHTVMTIASAYHDSVRSQRAANQVVAVAALMTDAERQSERWIQFGVHYTFNANTLLAQERLLDTLRYGTAAYVALKRTLWYSSIQDSTPLPVPIGEMAQPIHGDFWLGVHDTTIARPQRGKIGIVFVTQSFGAVPGWCPPGCQGAYATLRRIAQHDPEVDIVLVGQTRGWFKDTLPLPPAEEVDLWRRNRDFFHIPGVYAIEATEFWRLPSPDRRRINESTQNQENYTLNKNWSLYPLTMFLVDQDGIIIEALHRVDIRGRGVVPRELVRSDELYLKRLIDVLRTRGPSRDQ